MLLRVTSRIAGAAVLASTIALLASPAHAAPVWTTNSFANDAAFNAAYGGQGTTYESFGAEGRWGNNNPDTGIYEYNINRRNTNGTFTFGAVTGGKQWINTTTNTTRSFNYDFTLEYLGDGSRTVRWTVAGSPAITLNANFGGLEALVMRTSIRTPGFDYTLSLDNFAIRDVPNNITYTAPSTFTATSNLAKSVDYMSLTGFNLATNWILTGRMNFSWAAGTATPTSQTAFNFQVKGMQPVPEPGSYVLLGVGLVGMIGLASRRRLRSRADA